MDPNKTATGLFERTVMDSNNNATGFFRRNAMDNRKTAIGVCGGNAMYSNKIATSFCKRTIMDSTKTATGCFKSSDKVLCRSLVELVTRYGLQDLVRLLHVSPQDQRLVLDEAQQQRVAHDAAEAGQIYMLARRTFSL